MNEAVKSVRSKPPRLIIFIAVAALLGGIVGYFIGNSLGTTTVTQISAPTNPVGEDLWPESIVTSQDATAVGTVTKVEENKITLQGPDGKEAVFNTGPFINIYNPLASASAQPNTPKTANEVMIGRKVALSLHYQVGRFEVTTVTYLTK